MRAATAFAALATGAACLLWACGREDPTSERGPTDTGATARARAASFYRPPNARIPDRFATNPGTPWGDYVGAAQCKDCHPKAYAGWRASYHSKTLYDAVPQTVFGDFSGNVVSRDPEAPFTVRPFRSGERMYMHVEKNLGWRPTPRMVEQARAEGRPVEDVYGAGFPDQPTGDWEILFSFGNRRHQPYVTKAPDGRHWVLPVFWNDSSRQWRYSGWRPYVTSCATCHVTGIKHLRGDPWLPGMPRPDPPVAGAVMLPMTNPPGSAWSPPPAQEGWAEGAVSCELCHGPARPHVDAVRRMGVEGYRAYLAGGGAPTIYDPAKDTPENRMKQCDSCHNFMAESPVTWVPGPRGYDHEMLVRPIDPSTDVRDMSFYADGTDMSPCTVGRVFRHSKMGKSGKVECATCHDAHGNDHWAELRVEGNALCTSCHLGTHRDLADRKALEAHTRHPADGPGSSCIECHMRRDKRFTNGVEVMSDLLPSHDFGTPTGDESPLGPGPSCNVCHTDRDAAWTRETLLRWRRDR